MYNMKNKRGDRKRGDAEAAPAGPRRCGALSVVLSVVLPILFLVALLVQNDLPRWIFLGATAVSLLLMWALRAFVRSARNTLTVVYVALAVVIGLALFINRQMPETRNASAGSGTQSSFFNNPDPGSVNAMLNELATPAPETEEESFTVVSEAQLRLDAFFSAWSMNSVTEMKNYCLPSWVNEQTSVETVLFQMLRRSRPLNYTVEDMTGSDGEASRIITVKAAFDENGVTVVKRMRVIMKKNNDVWYVDPNSLDGVIVDEAAEAAAASDDNMPHWTIAPTAEPTPAGSGQILYYNENGGKYYHTDRTCPAVSSEYWPLTGKIPIELLNSAEYSKLLPCSKCGAPARPAVGQ